MQKRPKTPKKEMDYVEANCWGYLTTKLYVKGIKDNNLTARQIWDYIHKHYKSRQ